MALKRTYIEAGALTGALIISGIMTFQGAYSDATTIVVAVVSFIFGNRYGNDSGRAQTLLELQTPVQALSNPKKIKEIKAAIENETLSVEDADAIKGRLEEIARNEKSKRKRLKLNEAITSLAAYIEYKNSQEVRYER